MKLVLLSDTHTYHRKIRNIPDGDMIIHSGDATWAGTLSEVQEFFRWFGSLPHKHKIFVPGNHDKLFERNYALAKNYVPKGVRLLVDRGVEIEGLFFYGSPWTPKFMYDWVYNAQRGPEIRAKWAKIPTHTDVLITHGPSYGIGDLSSYNNEHAGCEDLTERIKELKRLRLHTFGHIHAGRGIYGNRVNASSIVGHDYDNPAEPFTFEV